jgi:outer membrane protein assembly factor BamB
MNRLAIRISVFCALIALTAPAWAADSPQFRGLNRDGIYAEKGLLKTWPEGGPALLWKCEGVGQGYASVAVVGDTVYVPGMLDDNQGYLFAIDPAGKLKWKATYGPEILDKQANGARGTATFDGDRVYISSGTGVLNCLKAADGKPVWQRDVVKEYKALPTDWGFSESPLVDGDLVYATPGGEEAALVALNKMTGKPVWQTKGLKEASAYCSANIFTFGGRRVLVTMLAKSVVGIDPKAGDVLWTHKFETQYDIHAVTPVSSGNVIYYTGGYGSGGGAVDVSADGTKVTPKWDDKNLDCQHHGVVLVDGYIYGTGHKNNKLMCLELATGKLMWSTDEVTQGSMIYDDGMLYVYEGPKKGTVSLIKASPQKFERVSKFDVPAGKDKHWAHPVIANGRLYIRYAGAVYAYNIAAK